jgi:hypothetical protein
MIQKILFNQDVKYSKNRLSLCVLIILTYYIFINIVKLNETSISMISANVLLGNLSSFVVVLTILFNILWPIFRGKKDLLKNRIFIFFVNWIRYLLSIYIINIVFFPVEIFLWFVFDLSNTDTWLVTQLCIYTSVTYFMYLTFLLQRRFT